MTINYWKYGRMASIEQLQRELQDERTARAESDKWNVAAHKAFRNRIEELESALKEAKSRIRLLGETMAEHVSEEFMEARGLDWENWSTNNPVCTAPACGQSNPEPPYGEGGEEKP